MSALHDKLKKLAVLAAEGVGGERDNAEAIFTQLLKKNGLRREDFDSSDLKETVVWFSFSSDLERRLLVQIEGMVTDNRHHTYKKRDRKCGFLLRPTEVAEVKLLYDIYKAALKTGIEKFYVAFLHKHKIFPATPLSPGSDDEPSMSFEDVLAMKALIRGMDDVEIRQRLTNGGAT